MSKRYDISYAQMYLALERIKLYQSPDRLKKRSAKDWGLDDPNEAIEMAYENVLQEAKNGLRGVRRPAALTVGNSATPSPVGEG